MVSALCLFEEKDGQRTDAFLYDISLGGLGKSLFTWRIHRSLVPGAILYAYMPLLLARRSLRRIVPLLLTRSVQHCRIRVNDIEATLVKEGLRGVS